MRKNDRYFVLACLTLLIAIVYVNSLSRESRVRLAVPLEQLPQEFGEFKGQDVSPSKIAFDEPTADASIVRVYTGNREDQPIHVFVGYWENQNEAKRIKSPRYVEEGWGYHWMKAKQVRVGAKSEAKFNEFLNEKGDRQELVYYCFFINRKLVSGEYRLRMFTMINFLFHQKSNAAVVRVSVPVSHELPLQEAESRAEKFINDFLPLLEEHLPA